MPSSSFRSNDSAANTSFLAIVRQLFRHQRDLDFVDEYALSKTLKLEGKELESLVSASSQGASTIRDSCRPLKTRPNSLRRRLK